MSEDFVKNANLLKTMLIIVYDDHGGFYERVDSLADAVPLLGQNSGKLGPRVPGFVVSPWTPARLVLKDTFSPGLLQIKRGVNSGIYAQEKTADSRCHNAFGRPGAFEDHAIPEIATDRNERHRSRRAELAGLRG